MYVCTYNVLVHKYISWYNIQCDFLYLQVLTYVWIYCPEKCVSPGKYPKKWQFYLIYVIEEGYNGRKTKQYIEHMKKTMAQWQE